MPVVVSVTLLTALLACGADRIVNPVFGAACDRGRLQPGTITAAAVHEGSCIDSLHLRDRAYESFSTSLRTDAAYLFRVAPRPDPERAGRNFLEPIITLWRSGEASSPLPLAMSAGEGSGRDSEFFFVAEQGGLHRLQVSSSALSADPLGLGGFAVEMHACPVLRLRADTGATAFTLRDSPCRRGTADEPIYTGESPGLNFITIATAPGERLTFSIDAEAFTPVVEAFGPGMDTFGRLHPNPIYRLFLGEGTHGLTMGPRGGTLTLAVGAIQRTGASNRFTLRLTRLPTTP